MAEYAIGSRSGYAIGSSSGGSARTPQTIAADYTQQVGRIYRQAEAAATQRYDAATGRYIANWNEVVDNVEQAIREGTAPLSPEYGELLEQYKVGGEYGTGLRLVAERMTKEGLAAQSGAMYRAGMSSSAAAMNMIGGASRYLGERYATIEDMRIDKYARALEVVGAAREARYGRIVGAYLTGANILTGYREPSYQEFVSPSAQTYMSAVGELGRTSAGELGATERAEMQLAGQRSQIAGQLTQTAMQIAANAEAARKEAITARETAATAATTAERTAETGFRYASALRLLPEG